VSDYETTQRWRNITVGIFVIIALCALVWLIFIFQDLPGAVTEIRSFQIFVKFPTAPGVQNDTPVNFCGYQIGRVTDVMPPAPRYDERIGKTYYQTMCVLSIDKRYKNIPSNVNVKVMTRGLGSSYIDLKVNPYKELEPLEPNRPETQYLVNGMELQGSTGTTNEFFPEETQKKLEDVITGIEELVHNANDIIGDEQNKQNIQKTLDNLSVVTAKAADALDDLNQFTGTANEAAEELAGTIRQLRMISDKINSGNGTAAKFVNDGRLYENLLEDTEQLDVLIQDLKNLVTEYRAKGIKVKVKL
jgi:phospholipid/cholesterol/gamma-HCH transport system substrate-binding protein